MIKNENKVVLIVRGEKLTPKELAKTMRYALNNSNANEMRMVTPTELINGKTFTKVEVDDTHIKGLEKIAKKFGIAYGIYQNTNINEWQVYFKSKKKATGAIANAFKAYIYKVIEDEKDTRESILDRLEEHKEMIRTQKTNRKNGNSSREREKNNSTKKKKESSR